MPDPGLRYLSKGDVEASLPPVAERIQLARRAMVALVADADLPPKFGVHPRPEAALADAMPALLRGAAPDGSEDLLGIKWVVGFPGNQAIGLPAIHATVLLNDPRTGVPRAILDGSAITAHRTAAVSGVALAAWAPPAVQGRPIRVCIVGAGVQARSHVPVVAHLLPGASLVITDRHADRAEAVAAEARALGTLGDVRSTTDARAGLEGADVVITLVSLGPDRQAFPAEAFAPDALVVAVDYDMCVPAALARDASAFIVDERGQFLAKRGSGGIFAGYPEPTSTIGEALLEGAPRPSGRVLVAHLGVGLADLVFADAILRAADARGLGVPLPT